MIATFCFDGVEDDELVRAGQNLLAAFASVESLCAYGNAAERLITELAHHHGRPHHPESPHHEAIDALAAQAIASHGVSLLDRIGIAATPRVVGG